MPIVAFILILFFRPTTIWASEYEAIVLKPGMDLLHISQIHSLDNTKSRWDADEILAGQHDDKFIKHNKHMVFLGIPKKPQAGDYWVRFDLDNQTGQDVSLLTDYGTTPSISRVFFLRPGSSEIIRTEAADARLRHTKRLFSVQPGLWRIYIEVKPDEFMLPVINLDLKTTQALLHKSPESHFLTLSYGICLALMAYNFVLALTLRTRAHVIYVAYNITLLLYYEGRYQLMAEQFGIPELPRWSLVPINTSTSFLFLMFISHMLDIKSNLPAWKWPLRILYVFWPLLIIYSFIDLTLTQLLLLQMLKLSGPTIMAIALHSIIKKVPGARLLFISTILPGLGTVIHLMPGFFGRWLPMPLVTSAQLVAFDVEMILLSMTIGFKINREQAWLQKKIDHAYTELKTIVYPHQVGQIWEGMPLRKTMPLGEQNAFILVFDVVASSKMQIADPRGFLSGVFHDCSNLMMQNYQPDPLVANGYRVKEMGDGFLCSVGFPFGCPIANAADHSVQMAHQFLEIFRRHVAMVGSRQSIHCSIGIAHGPVEAFYPESGAQVYDLFGRGIILAHRYESMRDILFRWLKHRDDIIILHQPVFEQLSPEFQNEFVEVDLSSSDFKVRDDETALRLYYQLASGRMQRRLLRGA